MAWQADTTIASYRDVLDKIVEMATSKHVSAAVINAAGAGYDVGDILTIAHDGAAMTATVEVLTKDGGGGVTSIKLRNMGAYSNRVATVAVNVGGAGYAVDDVVEIETGTYTQFAKAKVTSVAAGVVDGIALFERGGAYTVAPDLVAATTDSDIGTGTGTGLLVNLTVTTLVGLVGIAGVGGAGAGATFDLTLTDTGWAAVRDQNNYSENGVDDEKEVVLEGTVAGGTTPFIGYRTYTDTEAAETRYGVLCVGMTGHNIGLDFENQPAVAPNTTPTTSSGSYIPLLNAAMPLWLSFTGRKMAGVVKTQGASILAYQSFYVGLLNPFGTTVENPYPLIIAASSGNSEKPPDDGSIYITGITEAISPAGVSGPIFFRRISDASWQQVRNNENDSADHDHILYPVGEPLAIASTTDENYVVDDGPFTFFDGICRNNSDPASRYLLPSPNVAGDLVLLVPVTLVRTPDGTNTVDCDIHGELDNVFWISGTKDDGDPITVEDTITISGTRYRIFANGHRRERYSFFCMEEA